MTNGPRCAPHSDTAFESMDNSSRGRSGVTDLILIGDSIRMGYQATVREQLADADIWSPEANGGDSANVLTHLDEWVLSRPTKVVHLNCGLHDIKKPFDTGQAQVSLDDYGANLTQIFDRIRETGATLVWATTTPVDQALHHRNKGFDRFAADVDAYNGVAADLATARGMAINDLHAVIEHAGPGDLLTDDGVHFTEEGSRLLGEAVVRFVTPLLTA
jgi:lysophospholipase L1-like esterase